MINVGRKGMREQNARIAQQPIRDMNPGRTGHSGIWAMPGGPESLIEK